MATAMRNADVSAVSTDRFRTCLTSMRGSVILSSCATHTPPMTKEKAIRPRDRTDVQRQSPPSLRTTDTPITAVPRVVIPR